jgi:peptide-methionine (S)-S-oxide reductase
MRKTLVTIALAALASTASAQTRTETAVLAGGCFWCVESDLEKLPGVISVVSGYAGGRVQNPTYEQVVSETTGHREVVRVTFDPSRLSYGALLDRYWRTVDPTDPGGQFCDRGESYTTAVFATPAQQAEALASRARAQAALGTRKIVTPILPAARFWEAEGYHQDYAKRNPVRYRLYRQGCGRDARVKAIWGR